MLIASFDTCIGAIALGFALRMDEKILWDVSRMKVSVPRLYQHFQIFDVV